MAQFYKIIKKIKNNNEVLTEEEIFVGERPQYTKDQTISICNEYGGMEKNIPLDHTVEFIVYFYDEEINIDEQIHLVMLGGPTTSAMEVDAPE